MAGYMEHEAMRALARNEVLNAVLADASDRVRASSPETQADGEAVWTIFSELWDAEMERLADLKQTLFVRASEAFPVVTEPETPAEQIKAAPDVQACIERMLNLGLVTDHEAGSLADYSLAEVRAYGLQRIAGEAR